VPLRIANTAADPGGLIAREAAERLKSRWSQPPATAGAAPALHVMREVLREPMVALLLVAGAVYLAFGDLIRRSLQLTIWRERGTVDLG
jgi:hypothetical protein